MKRTFTQAEMLAVWRNIRVAEPLRLDCTVSRTYGTDFTEALIAEMRAWYLHLLDCAPERMLAPENMAGEASFSAIHGVATIEAPQGVRRILRVRFADWSAPVVPGSDADAVRRAAANPYCHRPQAAAISPRVVIASGASGALAELVCVADHGEQTYVFDDSALQTILTDNAPYDEQQRH